MAGQYDGEIRINTAIDTDGIASGEREVEAAVRRMSKSVSDIGNSMSGYSKEAMDFIENYAKSTGDATQSNNEFLNEIEKAKSALKELEGQGKWFGDEDYDKAIVDLEKLEQAAKDYKKTLMSPPENANPFGMDTLAGKIREAEIELSYLADSGKGLGNKEFDEAYRKLSLLKNEAKEYAAELAKTPEQAAKDEQRIAAINQKLEEARAEEVQAIMEAERLKKIGENAEVSRKDIVKLTNELQQLKERQEDLSKAGLGFGYEEFDKNASRISEISNKLREYEDSLKGAKKHTVDFLSVFNGMKKSVLGVVKTIKKANSAIFGLNKQTQKSSFGIKQALKSMLLYGGIGKIISAVTNGAKEGMQNLAQYSGETNASISSLISALTRLKNSFATAFAPILNVVAPILTTFINLISRAVTYVGMLIAALTGQKTFTKAVGVQQDYAASLGDTANAAKDAADATNDAEKANEDYLSGLDEIHKFETNENKDTTGNTGLGNTGAGGLTPQDMFETVPIENSIQDMVKKIKDLIKSEDWEGLGSYMADGINKGLQKVYDAINWNNVGPKITYFVNAFTKTFNSLVDNIDWDLMGRTIGAGINTIVNTLNLLIDGIDWINLGKSFASGVMGIINEVDWKNLGNLLGNKFMIAWKMFYGFVTNLDYKQLGIALANVINGAIEKIDLGMIFSALSQFVIGLLEALSTAIQNTDWTAVGQQIADALRSIDWLGIASGLFDVGLQLVSGLLKAFGELPAPVQIAAAAIGAFFVAFKGMTIINTLIKLITGAGGILQALQFIVSALGGPVTLAITAAIAILVLLIANWDKVKETMQKFGQWLEGVFTHDWTKEFGIIGESFNSFFKNVKNIWDSIKQIFNGIITFINGVFSKNWRQAWTGISQILSGIFNSIVSILKTPINNVIALINGMLSGIVSGLNAAIRVFNKIRIPSWVPGIGGKGIHMNPVSAPRIPYLATGAVIPPNAPFMAMLGDQKNGKNIEAPEDLIRKIVREETANQGFNGEIRIPIILDGRQVYEAVVRQADLARSRSGGSALGLT